MNASEQIDKKIAGLDAKETRAIDINEGRKVNEPALKSLIRDATRLNSARK